MNSGHGVRLLILDDQNHHAVGIRDQILKVPPEEWEKSAVPGGIAVRPSQIEVRNSSTELVESIRTSRTCPYDVIICDINMGMETAEGALALLKALMDAEVTNPPCLLAMTQFHSDSDSRRLEIERLSDDPRVSVPCIPISKFKTLEDVEDQALQLDPYDWRDLVLRAIVHRTDHALLKDVKRDAALSARVEKIGPFRAAFKRVREHLYRPLVVLVSEEYGLQATLAEAFGRAVNPSDVTGLHVSQVYASLGHGGQRDLAKLDEGSALLLYGADEVIRSVCDSPEIPLGQLLLQLNGGELALDAGQASTKFGGLLLLSITPNTANAISRAGEQSHRIFERLIRIELPSYLETWHVTLELVDLMLQMRGLRIDDLDRAVMAAYNWDLGFDRFRGFAALRECVGWAHKQAGGTTVPNGLVADKLTETAVGRKSVYSSLGKDELLLYIFDRLVRVFKSESTQTVAAFLFYKTVCTLQAESPIAKKALARLWRAKTARDNTRAGAFEALRELGDESVKAAIVKSKGGWPDLSLSTLYSASAHVSEITRPRSTGEQMLEMLKSDFRYLFQDSPREKNALRAKLAIRFVDLKGGGRSRGRDQLGVLDYPYFSTHANSP
jgi:hypothetical protein